MHTSALAAALQGLPAQGIDHLSYHADGSLTVHYTNGGRQHFTAQQLKDFRQHLADNLGEPKAPRRPRPPAKK